MRRNRNSEESESDKRQRRIEELNIEVRERGDSYCYRGYYGPCSKITFI